MPDIFDTVMSSKGKAEKPKAAPIDASNRQPEIATRTMETFSGIPEKRTQEMWDASIEEDGDGGKILSFLANQKVINFKLVDDEEGKMIAARRLPDSDTHDFGSRGEAITTRFQAFNTSPSHIYGTWQNGKKSMTFAIERDGEGNLWKIKKKGEDLPVQNISDLIKSVAIEKKAGENPQGAFANFATMPLTHENPLVAYGLSAAIGAGAMSAKNIGKRIYNGIMGEEEEEEPSLLTDAAKGALGGMGVTGAFRWMGGTPSIKIDSGDKVRDVMYVMSNYMTDDGKDVPIDVVKKHIDDLSIFTPGRAGELRDSDGIMVISRVPGFNKRGSEYIEEMQKSAYSMQSIEKIKMMLQYDPTLTQTDKMILTQQLEAAMRNSNTGSGMINLDALKSMGFGALLGYILSKLMGGGNIAQVGSAIVGGMIGSAMSGSGSRHGPKKHQDGYTYYDYE